MLLKVDLPPVKFNLIEQVYFNQQLPITMGKNPITFYGVAKVLSLLS